MGPQGASHETSLPRMVLKPDSRNVYERGAEVVSNMGLSRQNHAHRQVCNSRSGAPVAFNKDGCYVSKR
eukprot:7949774-Pyramimonas_sp.AAC.1